MSSRATKIISIILCTFCNDQFVYSNLDQSKALSFPNLARLYGYTCREYNVLTEDGYILKLFRIPGNKQKSVFLMHGLIDSSDTFILRGKKSIAAALAEQQYDVWLGNTRGNKYSRRHTHLHPDIDKQFWNFTFHEMGVYDLRAFIDFILKENNIDLISLIGHSLGNTVFYVLGSERPEYNEKVNIAIALAPICYLNIKNLRAPVSTLINAGYELNEILFRMNIEQVFDDKTKRLIINVCAERPLGYNLCGLGVLSAFAGEDSEEFEPDFYYLLIKYYPTSTSRKNLLHLAQVGIKNAFSQFDYGPSENLELYNSTLSPQYNLNKVKMRIALIASKNDRLSSLKNVNILKNKLPNIVSFHVVKRKLFNHIDFVWGKHMDQYLFPHIFKLLNKYT